jgi:hypothetical protein
MADSQEVLESVALPLRRREQLRRVIAGQSVTDASIAVGYKNGNVGSGALSDTRKRLMAAMDHSGLTPKVFVQEYLLPLLNATQTQYFAKDGVVTDDRTDADNGVRLAALKEAGKLMALYPKEEAPVTAIAINITGIGVDE